MATNRPRIEWRERKGKERKGKENASRANRVEKEKERAASSSEMKRAGYSFPPSPLLFAPSGAVLPSAVLLTNSISIYHI